MHFSVLMIVKRAEDLRGFGFVMAVSSCGLYVLRIAWFRGDGNGKHFAGGERGVLHESAVLHYCFLFVKMVGDSSYVHKWKCKCILIA